MDIFFFPKKFHHTEGKEMERRSNETMKDVTLSDEAGSLITVSRRPHFNCPSRIKIKYDMYAHMYVARTAMETFGDFTSD